MYCVTKSLLTGLPVLSVPSRSCALASLETYFVLKESYAYCRVHPSSVVEQFDSSDAPTASQSLAWIAVLLFSEQESSQLRNLLRRWVGPLPRALGRRYSGLQATFE